MGRIVHIALKCNDLESFEKSTSFYEDVFGIYPTKTDHARGHLSRHMTDGNIDLALMLYDSEDEKEAKLAGSGPQIHHIGIEVTDRSGMIQKIEEHGGTIFSDRTNPKVALKYHAPDGSLGEIVEVGRYPKKDKSQKSRIAHVALKVKDLELATKFYEDVFDFEQSGMTKSHNGQIFRHMTDGDTDVTLYVDEGASKAPQDVGITQWGMEVANRESFAAAITEKGGVLLSKPEADAVKFRGPDGNVAVIVSPGGFKDHH